MIYVIGIIYFKMIGVLENDNDNYFKIVVLCCMVLMVNLFFISIFFYYNLFIFLIVE